MTSQGSRVNQFVKVFNGLRIVQRVLNTTFIPALQFWMRLSCREGKEEYVSILDKTKRSPFKEKKKKKKKKKREEDAPSLGVSHLRSNLGTSP